MITELEESLARAMGEIGNLQRQVNELHERVYNQERSSSPTRIGQPVPVTVNIPRMHSIMNRPDKFSGSDTKLSTVKAFVEKMTDYVDCQGDLTEIQKIKVVGSCLTGELICGTPSGSNQWWILQFHYPQVNY